ncbi:MAG: class I SAM-dependent methyltransferase [Nitrospira sp.]|nr:class I SAM-dependent methyltransferase [Nitrospira sp.]
MIYENDIRCLFKNIDLNEGELFYLNTQATRLAYTTNLVQEFCNQYPVRKVLDIGPHFLTRCIKEFIRPEISVSTLGYEYAKLVPPNIIDEHVTYNLTDCIDTKPAIFKNAPFDLIVFCETIEHLFISPSIVLSFIKKLLINKNGGLLIQTPNAVNIAKRIKMFFGENPFELLREDFEYKGHIREYTMDELQKYGSMVGFSVWRKEYRNYWWHLPTNKILRIMEALVPSFREGIAIFFKS